MIAAQVAPSAVAGDQWDKTDITGHIDFPVALAAGDLDGDGLTDVVASGSGGVILFYATGPAEFESPTTLTHDSHRGASLADIDRDGLLDLVTCITDVGLASRRGLGGRSFDLPVIIATGPCSGAYDHSIADTDGDGDGDLVWLNVQDGTVSWFENLGSGAFTGPTVILAPTTSPSSVELGDLDGDGDPDLVVTSEGGVRHLENQDGFHEVAPIFRGRDEHPVHARIADVNGDGTSDVVFATSKGEALRWAEQRPGKPWQIHDLMPGNGHVHCGGFVDVGDVDFDGDVDILAGIRRYCDQVYDTGFGRYMQWHPSDVNLYRNAGGGQFGAFETISRESENISIFVDVGNPAGLDVLSANVSAPTRIARFPNDGETFGEEQDLTFHFISIRASRAADLDGDNDVDVLGRTYGVETVFWLRNVDGVFSMRPLLHSPLRADDLWPGDIDGDGDEDVVMITPDDLLWVRNEGNGMFAEVEPLPAPAFDDARSIRAIDLDGDDDLDLIVATAAGVQVLENRDLVFSATGIPGLAEPGGVADAHDLDGDDLPELVLVARGRLWWASNRGALTFDLEGAVDVASNREPVFIDIDGDGDSDVLLGSEWIQNLGGRLASSPHEVRGPGRYRPVAPVDFDGDGDIDIAYYVDQIENWLQWSENLGCGNFAPRDVFYRTTDGFSDILAADLDGDGNDDLVSTTVFEINWHRNPGSAAPGDTGIQPHTGSRADTGLPCPRGTYTVPGVTDTGGPTDSNAQWPTDTGNESIETGSGTSGSPITTDTNIIAMDTQGVDGSPTGDPLDSKSAGSPSNGAPPRRERCGCAHARGSPSILAVWIVFAMRVLAFRTRRTRPATAQ